MKHDARFPSSRIVEIEVDGGPHPETALAEILTEHPFSLDTWKIEDMREFPSGRVVFSVRRLRDASTPPSPARS